ncbi:MAG: hypothetical protein V3U20_08930 [Thermoplasmata archaeon]
MAKKIRKIEKEAPDQKASAGSDFLKGYARDFLTLRNAIIQNCKDCIRDCGRDCLDSYAKPLENIRCPLQKVRMDYRIAINEEGNDFSRWTQDKRDGLELK